MANRKQIYYNKVTKDGITEDNMCPESDGDGVHIGDWEDDGINMDIQVCSLCDATGIAILNVDYRIDIVYEEKGPVHQIVKLNKDLAGIPMGRTRS